MSKLIMMMGIPGAGKTTWIKNNFPDVEPISRDKIRFEILDQRGGDYFDYEDEVFEKFIYQIIGSLVVDEIAIADATHLNKKSRAKVLNKVRKFADEIECIWIDVDIETAFAQNDQREGRAWVKHGIIRRMFFSLEAPEFDEGFDAITRIWKDEKTTVRKERE